MNLVTFTAIACLGSYLLGGIPFGVVAGRLKGIDVRRAGSGNIGAANVGRLLGRRWGVTVFILDALKGFVPAFAVGQILAGPIMTESGSATVRALYWLLAGLCAVIGHNYSPFLRFRGGKGVSTSLGVALGVYPDLTYAALVGLATWAICVAIWRMSSLGSIAAAGAFPLAFVVLAWRSHGSVMPHWPFLTFTLLFGAMVVLRHRANIARILAGTEARIGRPRPTDPPRPVAPP